MARQRRRTSLSHPTTPAQTLICAADADGKFKVEISLTNPDQAATYTWKLKKGTDVSAPDIASGELKKNVTDPSKSFKDKKEGLELEPELHVLRVTRNGEQTTGNPPSARRINVVPLRIEPAADMAGVIGDVVKSATIGSVIKHFVTPQKSGALNQPYVILKATGGLTADQITKDNSNQIVEWDGGEEVQNEPLKHRVKRDATGTAQVKIKVKQGSVVAAQMNVWVTWATLKKIEGPTTRIPANEPDSVKFRAVVKWEYKCEPESMFVSTNEVPNLAVAPTTVAPGDVHPWTGDPLSGGANKCYDATRQVRVVSRSNDSTVHQHLQDYGPDVLSYPSNSVEGNDDPNTNRELGPFGAISGKMEDSDFPEIIVNNTEAASNPNATILMVAQFKQFARLQVGDRWYKCSDDGLSELTFKLKRGDGKWVDDGSTYVPGNSGTFPPAP